LQYFFFVCLVYSSLFAHQLKENYLHLNYNQQEKKALLTLEIETRLFEENSSIDDNNNGIISFKELKNHKSTLLAYLYKHVNFYNNNQLLSLHDNHVTFHRYQDQTYMQVAKEFHSIDLNNLVLKYDMFFELEKGHKLLIHLDENRGDYIIDINHREYHFSSFILSNIQRVQIFIKSGIEHILDGYDHLLFILMLIIPIFVFLLNFRT